MFCHIGNWGWWLFLFYIICDRFELVAIFPNYQKDPINNRMKGDTIEILSIFHFLLPSNLDLGVEIETYPNYKKKKERNSGRWFNLNV